MDLIPLGNGQRDGALSTAAAGFAALCLLQRAENSDEVHGELPGSEERDILRAIGVDDHRRRDNVVPVQGKGPEDWKPSPDHGSPPARPTGPVALQKIVQVDIEERFVKRLPE